MAAGLKIWDSTGKLIVGPNTSVGTILGSVLTNKTNGSISDSRLSLGTPRIFAAIPVNTGGGSAQLIYTSPTFTFSGNTLSWSYLQPNSSGNPNLRIIFGVF